MSENEPSTNVVNQPHLLCALCQSYWERLTCLSFPMEALIQGGENIPSMPQHLLHSHHRNEIISAASLGCHFCSIILGSLVGCTGHHPDPNGHLDDPVYISIDILNQDDGTFLLTLFPCEQSSIFTHDVIMNTFQLRLRPIKKNTEATGDDLKSSRLQTSTYSHATAEYIKSWILECQNNHFLCGVEHLNLFGSTSPPTRPRRLLDVQAFPTGDRIQLIDAENDPTLEYCALSYSWGFSKPYRMTTLNLTEFQKEIHVKDLPKTLRDAIQAIRGIGFRYMWIDSLCIIQDGNTSLIADADWRDQAGKLHDIFGNAVITIAASEGVDGNQGFIQPRNPLSQIACRLNVCLDLELDYEVVPPCTPYCLQHPFDNAQYHLDTRGWVFQERILSPRTAHFTRNFLHLECRTELKCEAMSGVDFDANGMDDCHHSGAVPKSDYQLLFSVLGLGIHGLERPGNEVFLGYWHELMRKYSITRLSRDEDLLIALAGLAKRVHKQSKLTWSFGLWREHLLRGMLWYVRGGKGVPFRERAPSWSWASIKVQRPSIMHVPLIDAEGAPIPSRTGTNMQRPGIMHEPSTDVELIAKITALPETSKFTRTSLLSEHEESRYSVKILGPLRRGAPILTKAAAADDDPPNMAFGIQEGIKIYRSCQGLPDIHADCPFHPDFELPDNIELYSLLVARGRTKPLQLRTGIIPASYTEMGIILTPVARHDRRYRRVGYFHHSLETDIESNFSKRSLSLFPDDCKIEEVDII